MKTAVIYARYSSDRQTEQSIEGQIRTCREYAERNNIKIVDSYIDRAMSGTNDNRPAFQKMIKDSNKKAWDIVLVYKLDRFSRDKYETAIHKHTLRENGIKLVSAMENIPDTPEGIILESLLEGMNQYYSAELSQKVKRGMRENREKGYFIGGKVVYGYKVIDKKIYVDEDKAEIVRTIFDEYNRGIPIMEIVKNLADKGILYDKTKQFSDHNVYYILKNEKYTGMVRHDNIIYTNMYPRIISDEIYLYAQKKLDNNKHGNHTSRVKFLLKGKLVCGYCGGIVKSDCGTSGNGNVARYYNCKNKECEFRAIRKEILEDLVIKSTLEVCKNAKLLDKLADKIIEENKRQLKNQSVLNILTREYEEITKSIENILVAMEKGVFTISTKERLEQLEKSKGELELKIAIEESANKIKLTKKDILKFVNKAIEKSPSQMIDILIKQIKIYNDKIEIFYNYTDTQKPDDFTRQAFCFYETFMQITIDKHRFGQNAETLDFTSFLYI